MSKELEVIHDMVLRFKRSSEMLVSTSAFLDEILAITDPEAIAYATATETTEVVDVQGMITVSCDASITKNPGGDASVGFVFDYPFDEQFKVAKVTRAKTINEAEYDAVYEAITTLFNLRNNTNVSYIEVRSDSKLIIKQLNGEWKCNDERLDRRRQAILELVSGLPVEVKFVWLPRNSTPSLKLANDIAQTLLGVKNH